MANGAGSVKFVGDPDTTVDEAANYTVTDDQGNEAEGTILAPDYVVSDIPADQLKRWLLNANFEANDGAAEQAKTDLEKEQAEQVRAAALRSGEVVPEAPESEAQEEAEAPAPRGAARRRGATPQPTEQTSEGEASEAGEENN